MAARDDIELMQHADGELGERQIAALERRVERDPEVRAKLESLAEVDELVRSHLELSADHVPDHRFDAMWRTIDRELDRERETPEQPPLGVWARITAWLERYRGHVITGAVSAGAVAALALILRPGVSPDERAGGVQVRGGGAIDVRPAALRAAPEIESLDTPDGEGTVLTIEDEDGHTTVIWVSPADTVEGI